MVFLFYMIQILKQFSPHAIPRLVYFIYHILGMRFIVYGLKLARQSQITDSGDELFMVSYA